MWMSMGIGEVLVATWWATGITKEIPRYSTLFKENPCFANQVVIKFTKSGVG